MTTFLEYLNKAQKFLLETVAKNNQSIDQIPEFLQYGSNVKRIYNTTKGRVEWWHLCQGITGQWVLWDALPARVFRERFITAVDFVPSILGLNMEQSWVVNGRKNGAVAPDDTCFDPANEIGGGLIIGVPAGGQDNDYTAVHWGGNYPIINSISPHFHSICSIQQTTSIAHMCGLVDSSKSTGTNAFAYPDNCIWLAIDTDVDNSAHFIIRSGGVERYNASIGVPVATQRYGMCFNISDDGNSVTCHFDGETIASGLDISGAEYADLRAAQLQPYFVVVSRAPNTARQAYLHDFRLIIDAGF